MKSFKEFIRESKIDIDSICENITTNRLKLIGNRMPNSYGIINYTINTDGSINVDGDVGLNNERLTKLPLKFRNVGGDFFCSYNQLTSLEGCPQSVGGDFYCLNNQLTSLVGCPEVIGGDINCRFNKITDFKGVPEFFEGLFYCEGNPIEEIYTLFLQEDSINDSKCIQWINEFDVIQGDKVVLDRLEEVFHQLGMDIPQSVVNIGLKNLTFKNYEII
jgi:hypothetical protein